MTAPELHEVLWLLTGGNEDHLFFRRGFDSRESSGFLVVKGRLRVVWHATIDRISEVIIYP